MDSNLKICGFFIFSVIVWACHSQGEPTTSPSTQPADENTRPWKLTILHPSLSKEDFYTCKLWITDQAKPPEGTSVVLVLQDRRNIKFGRIAIEGYYDQVVHGWVYSGELNKELIKNSYFIFPTRLETADSPIKLITGIQKTFRNVDGEAVYEPIE